MKRFIALAAVVVVGTSACGTDLVATAAAVVNGDKITTDRVENALDIFVATGTYDQVVKERSPGSVEREFEQRWLSQLIRREVLTAHAEELGIEVTDAEVEEEIEAFRSQFGSEDEFVQAVEQQVGAVQLLRGVVRDFVLQQKIREEVTAGVGPGEAELMSYYEQHIEDYSQTAAQHILVGQEGLAQRLADMLHAASRGRVEKLFAQLARKHSEDQSNAGTGGDLGYFSPGDFVQPFEEAAAKLDVGEVSEPVKTEFGYHIIRVTDRREQSFDDVKAAIEQQLAGPPRDAAWQEWIVDAYRDADIRVNPRFGELDIQSQSVQNAGAADVPGAEAPSPEVPETPEAPPGG